MAAVAGLRGTGDWGTDERPKNFRELIMWRNPNGSAPLFALTSRIGSESVNDPEFSWWDEPNDLIRLQLNDGTDMTASDTDFVVDSGDPSSAAPGNSYGLATHLKPGDLLLVEKTESATYDNEIIQVTSVTSGTAFAAARGVAGTTPGAILDDAWMTKIGSAYAEGTDPADATSRNPIKYSNLCQIFKSTYDVTRTAEKTKARTGDVVSNDKKRKVFDHSRDIELSMMFGQKFETIGTNNKPLRYMGGLREFIPNDTTTIFGTGVTLSTYMDAVSPVFDWDTSAGDERIVFCGNGYLNTLNDLAAANGQVRFMETIKVYGMNLRRFVLPQGQLFVRSHPLMNRHALYKNSAFLIDFSALKYRHLRDTFAEDNIQTPGADRREGQWISEISMEVRHGGLSCGYHGNFVDVA